MLLECVVVGTLVLLFGFSQVMGVLLGGAIVWVVRRQRNRCAMIAVEGNVGAGKSTFVEATGDGVCENVAAWAPYLEWMPRSEGIVLATQLRVLADYMDVPANKVVERSWCSAVMFSALSLGEFDPKFLEAYLTLVRALVRSGTLQPPAAVVRINTNTQVCAANIGKRSQPGDNHMDGTYLAKVGKWHDRLYKFYEAIRVPIIEHQPGEAVTSTVERARYLAGGTRVDPESVCEAIDDILCRTKIE